MTISTRTISPRSIRGVCLLLACLLPLTTPLQAGESEPTPEQVKFFETHVRPVFIEHCQKCHGPDKQRSGLRLDSRAALLQGGDSGPGFVAGKPDESLLIEAVNYDLLKMPPTGKLPDEAIANLTRWVEMGAPWPGKQVVAPARPAATPRITDKDRDYWAFQPVQDPTPPAVQNSNWARNGIDNFILHRQEQEKLTPSPEADRRSLLRRLTYDLTGLPPTSAELEAFLADETPEAYSRVVERLLASPRYGEHWGRHWLDLVRYAESDGFRADTYRPLAWRYRDYVIDSFNADKPYDQFVLEQIAGDEIAPDDPSAVIATGYLRLYLYEYNQFDAITQWSDILNSVTDNTSDVFLGLGMGCARCHDHKFDPILQKDYFRLQAYFSAMFPRDDIAPQTASDRKEYEARLAKWEQETAEIRSQIDAIVNPAMERSAKNTILRFPEEVRVFMLKPESERTPREIQISDLVHRRILLNQRGIKYKDPDKTKLEELKKQLAAFPKPKEPALAYTVTDLGETAAVVYIPGDRQKTPIEPGIPSVINPEPAVIPTPPRPGTTGRRTALARWIADARNPLSTRVITNRIWQYHFGRGIVATASDFGYIGEPPSHPELLDWLTSRFIESGWSFKAMHRLIVNSATYRQSASHPQAQQQAQHDPLNRFCWRSRVHRLAAEQIRDSMLAATGELKERDGGVSASGNEPCRSIYLKVLRNSPDPLLAAFDMADGLNSQPTRNITTTPTQSLLMINGEWTLARAARLARDLQKQHPKTGNATLVAAAYQQILGRAPRAQELEQATRFLTEQRERAAAPSRAAPPTDSFPNRAGHAADLHPGRQYDVLVADKQGKFPDGDFTIEACVLLRSMYPDATVRTIAAQWDSDNTHPGWSLGVTSAKSAYRPRNLILQLVGKTAAGKMHYEVVASNLHLELNKPYYIAATVRIGDTSKTGITFHVTDLSEKSAKPKTAHIPHQVVSGYRPKVPLTIGGRYHQSQHKWDGLLDDVRLSSVALPPAQLLLQEGAAKPGADEQQAANSTVAFWQFEPDRFFADSKPGAAPLNLDAEASGSDSQKAPDPFTDLCHVLLNANEFLYID